MLCRAWAPFRRTALVELYRYFGASEATIFSKRGRPLERSPEGHELERAVAGNRGCARRVESRR
jgi:hypothetical protein